MAFSKISVKGEGGGNLSGFSAGDRFPHICVSLSKFRVGFKAWITILSRIYPGIVL